MVANASILVYVYEAGCNSVKFFARSCNEAHYPNWFTQINFPDEFVDDKHYGYLILDSTDNLKLYTDGVFTARTRSDGAGLSMSQRHALHEGTPRILLTYDSARIKFTISKNIYNFKVLHLRCDENKENCQCVQPTIWRDEIK